MSFYVNSGEAINSHLTAPDPNIMTERAQPLRLQNAENMSGLCTLGPEVCIVNILGALGKRLFFSILVTSRYKEMFCTFVPPPNPANLPDLFVCLTYPCTETAGTQSNSPNGCAVLERGEKEASRGHLGYSS